MNDQTRLVGAEFAGRYERLRAQQREALRQAEHLFQTLLHQACSSRRPNEYSTC